MLIIHFSHVDTIATIHLPTASTGEADSGEIVFGFRLLATHQRRETKYHQ